MLALSIEAKKMIYPIEMLTGVADLIVVGEIDKVYDNSYSLTVSEYVKGQADKKLLINNFEEWECDERSCKVEKGQRLCLFLRKQGTRWDIINGSTGELLIVNDSITIGGYEEFIHIDYQFTSYKLPYKEFVAGIKDFCKCYKYLKGDALLPSKLIFKKLCKKDELESFKNQSIFTNWLYSKMRTHIIID